MIKAKVMEVKVEDQKNVNRNRIIVLGSLTATILLLVLFYQYFLREKEPVVQETTIFNRPPRSPVIAPELAPQSLNAMKAGALVLSRPANPHYESYLRDQLRLIKEFKSLTKLDIDLPAGMDYISLDLDDEVATIYGTSLDQERRFTMFASKRKVSVTDVLNFLEVNREALPLIQSYHFLPEKTIKWPAPTGSGLGEFTIIPATTVKGKTVYGALSHRKDNAGSYFFLFEAREGYFSENEGFFDRLLGSLQTRVP